VRPRFETFCLENNNTDIYTNECLFELVASPATEKLFLFFTAFVATFLNFLPQFSSHMAKNIDGLGQLRVSFRRDVSKNRANVGKTKIECRGNSLEVEELLNNSFCKI